MESINLKVLPFVLLSVVFGYLSFSVAARIIDQIEIILDFQKVLQFYMFFILFSGLLATFVALTLSQVHHIYFRLIFFFILFFPFGSVFLLSYPIDPMYMVLILIIFVGMVASILLEFNHLFGNQIKATVATPARANVKSMIFFIALAVSLIFFGINNTAENQEILGKKILNQITNTVTQTISDYGVIDSMINKSGVPPQFQGMIPKDSIKAEANKTIKDQIEAMAKPYMQYIVYILTFLIFATVGGATTVAGLFTMFLSMFIVYLLKSSGYLKETKKTIEVTRLIL